MPAAIRPRTGRATRDAILDTAVRLIHVQGYHATSLDEVLRESGVGKGNFYYHFRSKEQLGFAVLDRVFSGFLTEMVAPCFTGDAGSPLARVQTFLERLLEAQRRRNGVGGCALGNLACELADTHEEFRRRLSAVFSTWQAHLTGALDAARQQGELPAGVDPAGLSEFLVASVEGAMLATKLTRDVAVLERGIGELKRYLALLRREAAR